VVVRVFAVAIISVLFAPSLVALAATGPAVQEKHGTLTSGCQTLGVAVLCHSNDTPLRVGGKPSEILMSAWDESYEMERRDGAYRVKVGNPEDVSTEFFYFSEISFHKVGSRYLATKYVTASKQECEGRPDLRRIDEIDFKRRTITTILEPAQTYDGKRRRYVHPIRLKTSDIHRLSEPDLFEFLANTPADKRLCEDYG
jgi:hypothetical protein